MILSDWFWGKLKKKLTTEEICSIMEARIAYSHCPAGYTVNEELLAPYLVTVINKFKMTPIKDL